MSAPKFTKGPWNLDALSVVDSENRVIARCHYNWLFSDDDDEVLANAEANAALIAAAPEMYDFVQFFEKFAGQCYCRTLGEAGQKIYDEAVRICKKARGEK